MGIRFGDDADVEVGGDMVGGDKIALGSRPYHDAGAMIMASSMPLVYRQTCMQDLEKIRQEMTMPEPSPTILETAARSLAEHFPKVLEAMFPAIPGILAAAPAIAGWAL